MNYSFINQSSQGFLQQFFLLLLVCCCIFLYPSWLFAQDSTTVEVTGAGSNFINGSYTCIMEFGQCRVDFGHVTFQKDDNPNITIEWSDFNFSWVIQESGAAIQTIYYINSTDQKFPPETGWTTDLGSTPAPTLQYQGASGSAPTAITDIATNISSSTAVFKGRVQPGDTMTTVEFVYGRSGQPVTRTEAEQSPLFGSAEQTVTDTISGLSPGTTYFYHVEATNDIGSDTANTRSFTTDPLAPTATTNAATNISKTEVQLNGSVNPGGGSTSVSFEYWPTGSPGSSQTENADQSPLTGMGSQTVSKTVTGLTAGTNYTFRVSATNSAGTDEAGTQTFSTPSANIRLTSSSPVINASNIAVGSNITLSFDGNVKAASVNAANILFRGAKTGIISGSFGVSGNTITFDPDEDMRSQEVINVVITENLQSTGNQSAIPATVQFTTSSGAGANTFPFPANQINPAPAQDTLARSIYAADIDSDGDMDAVGAFFGEDKVAWYDNDGSGNFTEHVITIDPDGPAHGTSDGFANTPNSVLAADVDSDGDMDILSASGLDDKIAWYENNGSQSFSNHVITDDPDGDGPTEGFADGPTSIFTADVDSDGDMDVLSSSVRDDKIAWYENDGSQNFTPHFISTNAHEARSVYAADMDNDGDIDVLSASENDDKIAWYENDGSQNFTSHTITTNADGASSVEAADVDGDGDMDAISTATNVGTKVAWYENDGSQSFTEHEITQQASIPESVEAADINGDGDVDLLVASEHDNTIALYENDGTEVFTRRTISTKAMGAHSVVTADVDNDGDLDVMSASDESDVLAWHEQVAKPVSTPNLTSSTPAHNANNIANSSAITLTFNFTVNQSSVNPDAIRIKGEQTGLISGAFNTGGSTVTFTPDSNFKPGEVITVSITDKVQGTGAITAVPATVQFTVASGPAPGIFSKAKKIDANAKGARSVYAADIDSDGDMDILSASVTNFSTKLAWYKNDGNQNFTEQVLNTTIGSFNIYPADLDSDGDMDILSTSASTDEVYWFENDGNQNFSSHTINSSNGSPGHIYATDLDNDGDLDILIGSEGGRYISWYENDGSEQFTERLVSADARFESIYAADIDKDGDMDVIAASELGAFPQFNETIWYENNGEEHFTEQVIDLHLGSSAEAAFAADINSSGELDVVNNLTQSIEWFVNDGSQNFTQQTVTSNIEDGEDVFAADLDGDGDTDILEASNAADDKIAWYENDGSQTFTEHVITNQAEGARSVYAADIDNDGDLDVLSASEDDNTIAWYENVSQNSGGSAISFEGVGEHLFVPEDNIGQNDNTFDNFSSFTIETWLKPTNSLDSETRGGILEKHDPNTPSGYWIDLDGDITVHLETGTGSLSASSTVNPVKNVWTHLAVTYDGTNITIYLDGKDVTGSQSGSGSGTIIENNAGILIGKMIVGGKAFDYDGIMDGISIWNRQRSQQEIHDDMFQSLEGNETGLIGYWPMEQGSGLTVDDKTTQDHDAEFNGGPSWSTDVHPFGTLMTGREGWRLMSAPVDGSSYESVLDPLWTQGIPSGADVSNGDPNVFTWDNSSTDASPTNWQAVSDLKATPKEGNGFLVYVFEDDDFSTPATDGGFPKMITHQGSVLTGQVSPTVNSNGGGFTLLGNPYGRSIDFDLLSKNHINAVYVWDPNEGGSGNWLNWTGSIGELSNGLIAPFQGMLVQNVPAPGGTPSLTIDIADQAPNTGFRGKPEVRNTPPHVRLKIKGNHLSNTAWLSFIKQGQLHKNVKGDAAELKALNTDFAQLATTKAGKTDLLDINNLPDQISQTVEIPLIANATQGGDYLLEATAVDLPKGISVSFKNMDTGEKITVNSEFKTNIEIEPIKQNPKASSEKNLRAPTLVSQAEQQETAYRLVLEPKIATSVDDDNLQHPDAYELMQNYPNPFNPATTIRYALPERANVSLKVYDLMGREVATLVDEAKAAGRHSVQFDAANMASGVYLYRLDTGGEVFTRKMVLIK